MAKFDSHRTLILNEAISICHLCSPCTITITNMLGLVPITNLLGFGFG